MNVPTMMMRISNIKTFELVFFNWNKEIEYERRLIKCDTYGEMMKIAENRSQEIMIEKDLEEICWDYTEVF